MSQSFERSSQPEIYEPIYDTLSQWMIENALATPEPPDTVVPPAATPAASKPFEFMFYHSSEQVTGELRPEEEAAYGDVLNPSFRQGFAPLANANRDYERFGPDAPR